MIDDPRAALTAALDGDGPATALQVLRHAIDWSARSVAAVVAGLPTDEATSGASTTTNGAPLDTVAIEVVIALDDALTKVDDLLEQVPGLAEVAVAGTPVTEYLRRQSQALGELSEQMATARLEHEALRRVETELRACRVEHDEIIRRIDELRQLERLAAALPEMRRQHEALSQRLKEVVAPVAAVEQALRQTADQVVTLNAAWRADLGERTQQLLADLESAEAEWSVEVRRYEQEKAQLAKKTAEYEDLRAERDQRLTALQEYARIDIELLNRLSAAAAGTVPAAAATNLHSLLDGVQHVLEEVDDGLRDVLDRYDRFVTNNQRVLQWRDDPA